jgi:hypothetical protein
MLDAFLFVLKYNLRWQRLLYVLVIAVGSRIVFDGFNFPHPWWMAPIDYLLAWVTIVILDSVLRRFSKTWPE